MEQSPTYTVDDLFALPGLGTRTELIDGSLVLPSPQTQFHSVMTDLLVVGLRRTVPRDLKVERQMTVVLDDHNAPQPDLSVVRAEAVTGFDQDRFVAKDLVLAVEVVSPDSEARDRDAKPRKYAAAGIPYFWLVEMSDPNQHPVVRAYEIDPVNKTYALTGIHHDHLKLTAPYDIDVDITRDTLNEL
ncbi:Uma2 family endonuclease [Streptomyces sp. NPDC020898]|uniref:Uma2 family endonuclease n=1 Tax=Streptomyces sp. NPDC020898 TaxID=3365101 RepID=UPI0037BB0D3D